MGLLYVLFFATFFLNFQKATARPIESFYICESSLNEIVIKLHRSSSEDDAWFKEVHVPLNINRGSFESLFIILRKQFYSLCLSQNVFFLSDWSVIDCTNDILNQTFDYIISICQFSREWQDIELELIKLSKKVIDGSRHNLIKNEIESEDMSIYTTVGQSTEQCDSLRQFSNMFVGPISIGLYSLSHMIKGENKNKNYDQAIKFLKESEYGIRSNHSGWSDLCLYALASIEYFVGAGRWNQEAFPEAYDMNSFLYTSDTFKTDIELQNYDKTIRNRELSDRQAVQYLLQIFDQTKSTSILTRPVSSATAYRTNKKMGSDHKTDVVCSDLSSSVKVITVVSEESSKLYALRESVKHAGPCVELEVVIAPETPEAWSTDWKPRLLYDYLRQHVNKTPEQVILFVDGYDVLVSPNLSDLPQYLEQSKTPIVFAAERDGWPDAALCKWLLKPPYLNAGVFAGKTKDLLYMFQTMQKRYGEFAFCGDDQRAYQRFAIDYPHFVSLDESSEVFQCMHGYSWDISLNDKEVLLVEVKNGILIQDVIKKPLVLHFNAYDGKQMMNTVVNALGYEPHHQERVN